SNRRVLAVVPDLKDPGPVDVVLESGGERRGSVRFHPGKKSAEDLHPVADPAFYPAERSPFVKRAGFSGGQLPVSLFRIDVNSEISEFSGDITNPTGIAFDGEGQMFVTSRMDGTVYRMTPFKEAVPFARNLGVATGIAFNSEGRMYVGDRTGTIYQVNEIGEPTTFATLEPSMAAFHLAFGPDGYLYVTGPTLSSFETVSRVSPGGEVTRFFSGLGRPQGMAFDKKGNLYVAASRRGHRGVLKITPDAE